MTDREPDDIVQEKNEDRVLNPANLDAEHHALERQFQELLAAGEPEKIKALAMELSPGDLSEVLRPMSVPDTALILRLLPPDPLAEVLAEIDNRSLSALFTLLDIDEIADIIEEMPSDDATDVLGDMEDERVQEILAAMEEEERGEVAELLRHSPESAGGIMAKEVASCHQDLTCGDAVAGLRHTDEDDLEEIHFVFVVDDAGRLTGRLPLVRLLLTRPAALVRDVMESDPLAVEVSLDQEEVAAFFRIHDLISVPVVDQGRRLVGMITADDVLDVMEEEATEDFSRLAGVSVEEYGEQSSFRVARSRLPWLLGALVGQMGAVMVLGHFQASLQAKVALTFYIPMIMATAGNIGIQTSSVVVRGLATGEVDFFHLGRHMMRELGTALAIGLSLACAIFLVSFLITRDKDISMVLGLTMVLVIHFAAMAGAGIPIFLHRLGVDPAVATGPFITTANDMVSMLIYLGLATLLLGLGRVA